jgi:hypothetical protein
VSVDSDEDFLNFVDVDIACVLDFEDAKVGVETVFVVHGWLGSNSTTAQSDMMLTDDRKLASMASELVSLSKW